MKTELLLQYVIANVIILHCNCLLNLFDENNHVYPHHMPYHVQSPRPTWGCIECTYANRALCCRYFQRCCATANFQNLGSCLATEFKPYCSDKCTSDGQCPSGQKCCPPSNPVCLIPFGLNECPLSVSSNVILRPCTNGCFANEICCPNPRTPGCCSSTQGSGPFPAQNQINPG